MKYLLSMLLVCGAFGCGESGSYETENDSSANGDGKVKVGEPSTSKAEKQLEVWGANVRRDGQGNVFSITLSNNAQITDRELLVLKELTSLQKLDLRGTRITECLRRVPENS